MLNFQNQILNADGDYARGGGVAKGGGRWCQWRQNRACEILTALWHGLTATPGAAEGAPRSGQKMTLATNTVTRDDVPSEVVTALEGWLDRYW